MRAAAAEAVALEADPASPWYALARVSYVSALYLCGDFDAAFVQARRASPAGAPGLIRVLGFAVLSLIAVDRGELDQAEQWARTAQEILARAAPGLSAAPQSSLVFTAAGEVAARRGRLTEARWEFERALESREGKHGVSPGPRLNFCSGSRRCFPTSATGPGPSPCSLKQGRFSAHPRTAPRLSSPGWTGSSGASRACCIIVLGAPLTEREAAVLRLLRGSLSLREIGQELYLSQNTIKTHTQAIYRKLGVSSSPMTPLPGDTTSTSPSVTGPGRLPSAPAAPVWSAQSQAGVRGQEREDVRRQRDRAAHRPAGVADIGLAAQQNGPHPGAARRSVLQRRAHLAGVHRVDPGVVIEHREQHAG